MHTCNHWQIALEIILASVKESKYLRFCPHPNGELNSFVTLLFVVLCAVKPISRHHTSTE